MSDQDKTPEGEKVFDFSAFPEDTLFHERRGLPDAFESEIVDDPTRRPPPQAKRQRPERRKRIDPTTFEKQYSSEEMEFMSAMQRFKVQTGKPFPTHCEVLRIAHQLGYRKTVGDGQPEPEDQTENA